MKIHKLRSADVAIRSRAGFWLLIVAALALESIACVQYFYSRAAIKDEAVYRAQAELKAAELEINVYTAEMEAAAKVLAMMAEHNLRNPETMYTCTQTLLETLDNVESAGIAFVPDYYPSKGRWYEVCSSRKFAAGTSPSSEDKQPTGIYTRQIGGPDHDYFQTEWYHNGLEIDSAWWSEPYTDEAGAQTMVVSCSYPVRDDKGVKVAVVCIDLSLNRLKKVSEHLQVYKDSYYSILSSAGSDIVARPDTMPGRKHMTFDEEINTTGWKLSVIIPEDILFVELRKVSFIVTILMLLSLGLLAFILYKNAKNLAELISINTQKERIEGELETARTIQNAMLPKVFPPFSDRPDLNIYGFVQPAKEIGGDLYDFYIRHERLFFCVGDVSGKGVPASLVMATIRSLFRSTTAQKEDPAEIAKDINNTLSEQNDQNMFVTLFVGVLNLKSGDLQYCNAGHNAPILLGKKAGNVRVIDVLPNLPVGVLYGFEYQSQSIRMTYGETLFLYTDGLSEAEDSNHRQFGEERMKTALSHTGTLRPRQIVQYMEKSVSGFVNGAPQSDDLTMLAIRYQIPAIVLRNDIQQIPTLAEWVDMIGVPPELNMPINLALEETVSNVMLYAYPGQENGRVVVEYVRVTDEEGEKLVFTVTDSGVAFDPTLKKDADISLPAEERPVGGLGIHLVRQLMDEICYERTDGKNILTLIKKI